MLAAKGGPQIVEAPSLADDSRHLKKWSSGGFDSSRLSDHLLLSLSRSKSKLPLQAPRELGISSSQYPRRSTIRPAPGRPPFPPTLSAGTLSQYPRKMATTVTHPRNSWPQRQPCVQSLLKCLLHTEPKLTCHVLQFGSSVSPEDNMLQVWSPAWCYWEVAEPLRGGAS